MGIRRVNVELLVGAAEVAEMLGYTRGRVSHFAKDDPTFPEPVHHVRATPLWLAPEIENWKATRVKKRAGRPSKLQKEVIDYVIREMGDGGKAAKHG